MTLREELIAIIERLPEDALLFIAPDIQELDVKASRTPDESLARARAFRARMKARYGLMRDSVEVLHEVREERLNDLMGLS